MVWFAYDGRYRCLLACGHDRRSDKSKAHKCAPVAMMCIPGSAVRDAADAAAQAILDMLRIITAIILLGLGAWVFKRDTTQLVLVPIERMFKKVTIWNHNESQVRHDAAGACAH